MRTLWIIAVLAACTSAHASSEASAAQGQAVAAGAALMLHYWQQDGSFLAASWKPGVASGAAAYWVTAEAAEAVWLQSPHSIPDVCAGHVLRGRQRQRRAALRSARANRDYAIASADQPSSKGSQRQKSAAGAPLRPRE